jgi:hypothetical protein
MGFGHDGRQNATGYLIKDSFFIIVDIVCIPPKRGVNSGAFEG